MCAGRRDARNGSGARRHGNRHGRTCREEPTAAPFGPGVPSRLGPILSPFSSLPWAQATACGLFHTALHCPLPTSQCARPSLTTAWNFAPTRGSAPSPAPTACLSCSLATATALGNSGCLAPNCPSEASGWKFRPSTVEPGPTPGKSQRRKAGVTDDPRAITWQSPEVCLARQPPRRVTHKRGRREPACGDPDSHSQQGQ